MCVINSLSVKKSLKILKSACFFFPFKIERICLKKSHFNLTSACFGREKNSFQRRQSVISHNKRAKNKRNFMLSEATLRKLLVTFCREKETKQIT